VGEIGSRDAVKTVDAETVGSFHVVYTNIIRCGRALSKTPVGAFGEKLWMVSVV
jgi:hypothetical protein